MGRAGTSSQVISGACNSPLLRMLRASITSSRRRKLSASLWRGSRDSHNDFRIGGLNRPPITGINAALLVALDTRTLF